MLPLSLGFDQIALLAGGTFSWLWVRLFVGLCHLCFANWKSSPTVSIWDHFFLSALQPTHCTWLACPCCMKNYIHPISHLNIFVMVIHKYICVLVSCNACILMWLSVCAFGWIDDGGGADGAIALCRRKKVSSVETRMDYVSAFEMLQICFPIPMYHTLHFLLVNRSVIPACLSEISFAFSFL